MNIETIAARAAHRIDAETGAIVAPIHPSATFERDPDGGFSRGYIYARAGNPTRSHLERALAALEGGADCAAFASGSAATAAVFQSLRPGDSVVAPVDCYHGTAALLRDVFAPWGLQVAFVDAADPDALQAAVRPGDRAVWIETPSNPMLRLTDIRRSAEIAHAAGALLICDNTWATPMLQRPFDLGADIAVHSTTKYLSGHSDTIGGAVVAADNPRASELFAAIRRIQGMYGAVPSPFDCWLALRGMRTLHLRMAAHSANACAVAEYLRAHPQVKAVHYPGLDTHPAYELALSQMKDFGGMLSFQVKGGKARAMEVAAKLRLFTRATSLGGTESLIEHRASVEGPHTRTPDNLLRVSVGIENPDDLLADLAQALA